VLHNLEKEERIADFGPYQTDKPISWSPKGTYLVIIKSAANQSRLLFNGIEGDGWSLEPI
jgi:hypothetical protein